MPSRSGGDYCQGPTTEEHEIDIQVSMPSRSGGDSCEHAGGRARRGERGFYALEVGRGLLLVVTHVKTTTAPRFYALEVGRGLLRPRAECRGDLGRLRFYALEVGRGFLRRTAT